MPEVYTAQLAYVVLSPCFKHTQATNSCKELQKSIPEVYTAQLADAVLSTCFKQTQGTKGCKQLQKSIPEVYTAQLVYVVLSTCFKHRMAIVSSKWYDFVEIALFHRKGLVS